MSKYDILDISGQCLNSCQSDFRLVMKLLNIDNRAKLKCNNHKDFDMTPQAFSRNCRFRRILKDVLIEIPFCSQKQINPSKPAKNEIYF